MITIEAIKKEREIVSLRASGHSGYAPRNRDIVCAAVSTLLQALAVGLIDVLGLDGVQYEKEDEPAYFSIRWPLAYYDERAKSIVKTIFFSLKAVETSYPEHVKVVEVDEER